MHPMHEKRSYGEGPPLDAFLAKDLAFLAHWHTDVELLYVVSGSIIATVNQERRLLGEGSLVACGSRDIHHYERAKGGSETILVIFKPELLGHIPSWPAGGRLARNFATKAELPALAASAGRAMRVAVEEMRRRERAYEGIVRGRMIELCAHAERELASDPNSSPGGARGKSSAEGGFPALERMQLAIDFIYERSSYPIGLADAARAASLSPSYFSRVFAKTVGTNFRAFLNGVRIERAEELMSDSGGRLADIALECGFESVRTFNRAFRALRGRAPGARRSPSGAAPGRPSP
jgi:AraC-like DNA-binding protein